jgi:hypothetical protein
MKKFVLCLSVVATMIIQILSSSNLRAQTFMPQLADQDPPPDPIFCTAMASGDSAHDQICLAQR